MSPEEEHPNRTGLLKTVSGLVSGLGAPLLTTTVLAGLVAAVSLTLGVAGLQAPSESLAGRPEADVALPTAAEAATIAASLVPGPQDHPAAAPLREPELPNPATTERLAAPAVEPPVLPPMRQALGLTEVQRLPELVAATAAGLGETWIRAPELAPPGPTPGLLLGAALMRAPDFPILEPPKSTRLSDADESPLAPTVMVRKVSIKRGDTLAKVLLRGGADASEAYAATRALTEVQDPRKLRVGQELTLTFDTAEDDAPRLVDVSLAADIERSVVARLDPKGDFKAETVERPLEADALAVAGEIDGSLYAAADEAGVPARVIVDLIRLYSFDVDFQRDIQPGDRFQLYYEVLRNADGEVVKSQDILYARLIVGGKELPLYRFRHKDGDAEYYNEKGESVRKALMKTPIDGARLSSRYGLRRHPILGYTKMHRGIDFAAPRGTPIMAAGDGKVEVASWNGSYGRYVRIRHTSEFKTAYAHMTRIAKSVHPGSRVRQGEIIGYVGTTGRSTGPHLHYEVLRGNRQVNPLGLKLPTGRTLSGNEHVAFQKLRQQLDARYTAALPSPVHLAKTDKQ